MRYVWDSSFDTRTEFISSEERILLSYRRARAIIRKSGESHSWLTELVYERIILTILPQPWIGITLQDIQLCTDAFINMHQHPIMALDGGCTNIIACHMNLFLGTLALLAPRRADLLPLVQSGLRGDIIGNFLLSEIGHGLDIMALETIAKRVSDGYILHTPTESAAK